MPKRIYLAGLFSLGSLALSAQNVPAPVTQPAHYRTDNPYYWKNRKPYEGYWQQDVKYKIDASLDDKDDRITAKEELTYYNNSPDTLQFVYFHLYENAFQPGSYTDALHKANKFPVKYGKHEAAGEGTKVENLMVDGQVAKTELDNTIMKVYLNTPLVPGASVTFTMDFNTWFDAGGSIRRRMKIFTSYGVKHYDGVHWYPRICVYDRKFGWETDQHLTREFYGDFGEFDVNLTLPSQYILGATGEMTNESEVLPADLMAKLQISNFAKKPLEEKPSIIIPVDGTTKTWKFHAVNVHDFAWTADPTYRIGETEWNGVKCYAYAQEPHCARWQNASAYTAKVIQVYSTDFGMYLYPKMIVADARDGMEYPMLTLDGGLDPDYRDLIAHEVGHNWFFGMVGSNETYRALLDEGFTQFLTAWSYRKIDGDLRVRYPYKSHYAERYRNPDYIKNSEVYDGYMFPAAKGDETVIDTHSDYFNGALRHGGGYSQVYMKTATMLYNLQYVLGDSLFIAAMSHYFNQYKLCHPYLDDFRNSIIQYTHVDLNWFFDQWLTTNKTIDYAVKDIARGDSTDQYVITLHRRDRGQSPIDFTVIANDGRRYNYYIPNNWFVKKTSATVLPRWIGWDKIDPEYKAHVTIPGGIYDVQIDTTHRLADVNMLNNSKKMPVNFRFDSKIANAPTWETYEMRARPDIWYNGFDGIKGGAWVGGSYMNTFQVWDASFMYNTGAGQTGLPEGAEFNKFDQFSITANYKTPLNKLLKNSNVYAALRKIDGLEGGWLGYEVRDRKETNRFYAQYKIMYRPDSSDLNYLLLRNDWGVKQWNNTITLGVDHPYSYRRGNGLIQLAMKSSAIGSNYDYKMLTLNVVNKNDLGKININTRTYVQWGTGSNWAKESMLFAAGANPEDLMENKYTRAQGILPVDWAELSGTTNHFQQGGGLNLRGYAGYLMPYYDSEGDLHTVYHGTSGGAVNAELEFNELFKGIARSMPKFSSYVHIDTYLFGDVGIINWSAPDAGLAFAEPRADAGVGTALTIRRWGVLQTVKPLTIRFDMPVFLSRTPALDPDYVKFRWVLGINRAF